ncbi:hypothetical protein ONE63_010934 [Megalurothrips usitatus]|uniref:Meckelin n=1 Tax=Megalurothrips usitatus TaxID=439358 RepID=A0AAV7XIK8_9NEOP|nr:hypothetical protein ONE63_010934 [Megalurothrips usitatus]
MFKFVRLVVLSLIVSFIRFAAPAGEAISYQEPKKCKTNEIYDSVSLRCSPCEAQKGLVVSDDGRTCVCGPRFKTAKWDGAVFPQCERCAGNQVVTADGLDCVTCPKKLQIQYNDSVTCLPCSSSEIRVERGPSGSLSSHAHCIQCAANFVPSSDRQSCVKCRMIPAFENCSCPQFSHELVNKVFCVPKTQLVDFPDDRLTYTIEYPSGIKVDSTYMRNHLRLAAYQCKMKNHTACQAVANMCVLTMFHDGYRGSPCNFFRDAKHIPTSEISHLPWLFYGEGDAQTVLSRKKIMTSYSLDSSSKNNIMNLTIAKFSLNGQLLGLAPANLDLLSLCPGSWGTVKFGAHYRQNCVVPASLLLSVGQQPQFFELYLQYWDKSDSMLYAIPVLTLNLKDGSRFPNKETDKAGWQLVRRYFLADAISGVRSKPETDGSTMETEDTKVPSVIQYAKSLSLRVKVQSGNDRGRVYPPLLVVDYAEISAEALQTNLMVPIEFSISFEMDNRVAHSIEVAIIVLSVLSIVWAGIQTLSYSRRAGKVGVDLASLFRLVLLACGRLSDSFFISVAGAATHTFLFYKGQSVPHMLLPGPYEEYLIFTYVIVAFSLKIIEIAHMIWHQISIDIFLMDWERPRASGSLPRPQANGTSSHANGVLESQKVSIWRTYFIANEWNEIQTLRKTSLSMQLLVLLLCLKVFGWEQWALPIPDSSFTIPGSMETAPPNILCRFAVGVLVYLGIYILQWLFLIGLYERFIKSFVQDFVDVCSMANVSVFILSLENFGYYIHGRSVHGFADTDMQTMLGQLQREEDDLVGHRGLLPATEQQTFQMMIPSQLRACYRKVMAPLTLSIAPSSKRLSSITAQRKPLSSTVDRSVQAYHSMNKLLAAFLEHALKDLDYEVRSKLFLESVLDMEFAQNQDKGVLYVDNGHSFDSVLFYGNEWTLLTFDLMLFSFVDLLCSDYLLAAIVTGLVAQVIVFLRKVGGRKNLAKKTLIDERFLI